MGLEIFGFDEMKSMKDGFYDLIETRSFCCYWKWRDQVIIFFSGIEFITMLFSISS